MLTKNINQMIEETQAHIKVDQVKAGEYWNPKTKTGCVIGCLTHSDRASAVTERYGIPLPLVRILEELFERLSEKNTGVGIEFFEAIPAAIAVDNKDLSRVHWKFLKDCLEHLPKQNADTQSAINLVVEGLRLLSEGKDWPEAAIDAAYAALAAYAADAALAAYAAAYAADADYADADAAYAAARAARTAAYAPDSETKRQRDALLKLFKEAPVQEAA